MHSLMLMVCSDIPLRIARSAFKAASPLLPSGESHLLPTGTHDEFVCRVAETTALGTLVHTTKGTCRASEVSVP